MRGWERNKPKIEENELPHGDLECENTLIEEHARFGRVRTALMRELRGRFGDQVANRAMWRVSWRLRNDAFTGDDRVEAEEKAMQPASRLRSISELVKDQKEKLNDVL